MSSVKKYKNQSVFLDKKYDPRLFIDIMH